MAHATATDVEADGTVGAGTRERRGGHAPPQGHPLPDRHILPHGANTVDVASAIKYLGAATAHNHGQRARVPSLAWTPL